jgi:hypothetical protein
VLQLYPKVSHYHVLFTVAPYLILFVLVVFEVFQWCIRQWGEAGPSRMARLGLGACVLVLPLLFVPTTLRIKAAIIQASTVHPRTALQGLRLTPKDAEALDGVTEFIQRRTVPSEPIFIYPASPMFYLTAQRPNPTRFSYLPSGYIGIDQQQEIIGVLNARNVRWVIWDQELIERWGVRPADKPLVDYIQQQFHPAHYVQSYVIHERSANTSSEPPSVAAVQYGAR